MCGIVSAFRFFQRLGISITPNHFYWPIPDLAELERRKWTGEMAIIGIDLCLPRQREFLTKIAAQYGPELARLATQPGNGEYHYNNGFFESVDAEIAYCFVRHYQPARIIEVGGGYSTRVLSAALRANQEQTGQAGELVTIEPHPIDALRQRRCKPAMLIEKAIQEVDLTLFVSLREGDILFLDSSHVVSVGSDVVREYLEIVPRLAKGVLVHVHDIFLPSDYPRDNVFGKLSFWSEQYLLQALLMFNPLFEILWSSSAMQMSYKDELLKVFPAWAHSYRDMPRDIRRFLPTLDHDRVWPSSFWMRRI
jgi:hypothetical protein